MAGVHSRARSFDGAARSYARGRPGWPPEAVEIVARRLGLERGAVRNMHRLDAPGLEAMFSSFSGVAGLPPDRREAALAEIRGVLERHGMREAEFGFRTEITTARR